MHQPNPRPPEGADRRRAISQGAQEIRQQLIEMRAQLKAQLPDGIPVERFHGIVMTAVQMTPDLALCERKSLLLSVLRCAADGLYPDGRDAAIVPYNDRKRGVTVAQYMPMVAGILKRARNSGEITSVSAQAVYENDHFDYELGDREVLRHRPAMGERGALIGAYAIVRTRDGGIYRSVMDKHEIERRRAASAAPDSPAWRDWYDEQACKVVLRHCLKRAPQSSVLDRLLHTETIASPVSAASEAARAPMPDPSSRERTLYQMKCDALAALDEADTEAAAEDIFRKARGAFGALEAPCPIEIEAKRNERIEMLREQAEREAP